MTIAQMRYLVKQGFNTANRKALRELVGADEFAQLGNAYKRLVKGGSIFEGFAGTGNNLFLPSGEIELSRVAGELKLKFPLKLENYYYQQSPNQVF